MSYEAIKNTVYSDFYINEIWSISTGIDSLREKLLATDIVIQTNAKPENNILSNSNETHEIISSILNHAARLHKLFQSTSQRDGESDDDYKYRKERSKYLRKLLLPKKKVSHEIFKSGVRNATEHFDERLDLMSSHVISRDPKISNKAILYNMTLSRKEVFADWNQVVPIKVFIANELKYYMVDTQFDSNTIDLNEVFIESAKITANCLAWAEARPDEKGKTTDSPSGILKTPPNII